MVTKSILLPPDAFFHARPATLTASAAKPFQSMIMVMVGVNMADAKSAVAMMRLPHPQGAPVELMADGADELAALEAVASAIERSFSGQM
jgi:phosphotransferase system HPr (HPr) family protein